MLIRLLKVRGYMFSVNHLPPPQVFFFTCTSNFGEKCKDPTFSRAHQTLIKLLLVVWGDTAHVSGVKNLGYQIPRGTSPKKQKSWGGGGPWGTKSCRGGKILGGKMPETKDLGTKWSGGEITNIGTSVSKLFQL